MNPLLDRYMVYVPDEPGIVNSARASAPGLPLSHRAPHSVSSYRDLLEKVATLSFYNNRFRLLYRGQGSDYRLNRRGKSSGGTSLYPGILRQTRARDRVAALQTKYKRLARAESKLVERLRDRVIRGDRLVRWAVLQHYEVVPTPLLDVTPSVQTALSMAVMGRVEDTGYLYVLAFPQLSGPVSVSVESATQIIDLTQVCPPEAVRPHFQSAMLAGDYPTLDSVEATHRGEARVGNNFACRLISMFRLEKLTHWEAEGFTPSPHSILFPEDDNWRNICDAIRNEVKNEDATIMQVSSRHDQL